MNPSQGKSVLVTGASTGIGRATALLLDHAGYRVYAGVRRMEDGRALRDASSDRITAVLLDVTVQEQIRAAVDLVGRADAPLAGLVNNAGVVSTVSPLEHANLDDVRRQFDVNVLGHLAVTQACMPLLRKAGGCMVFVGSASGRMALPFIGPYCASKSALAAMVTALRRELPDDAIRVSLVEPGFIATPFWAKAAEVSADTSRAGPGEEYGPALARGWSLITGLARRAAPPEVIARVILRALQARRPRNRCLVGPLSGLAVLSRWLPERWIDQFMRRALRS